ncbi:acyltransferase family protein [Desulfovibrio inopinatus]|uniref:acyltransferase family protein n=1 Tax=Desulfovibrio inopinatus TaxID=102109 RepID=UPI000417F0CA|nr:acyltransferase [Desulfovibrio inopinatus]
MRERTDYLKGIAILAVMLGHWFGFYFKGDDNFIGGNGFVSIFFFLSGYGLYYSLGKIFPDRQIHPKGIFQFYIKRINRLYPLYWLVFAFRFATSSTFRGSASFLTFLALDFTSPVFLWFIPAIVQCYIISPLLFSVTRRYSFVSALLGSFLVVVILNFIAPIVHIPSVRVWYYRDVFLGHIFLFCLGMFFASSVKQGREFRVIGHPFLWGFLLIASIVLQRVLGPLDQVYPSLVDLLFPLAASFFCISLMQSSCSLPLVKLLTPLGMSSYGLYLLHPVLFHKIHEVVGMPTVESLIMLSLFPFFVFFSKKIEELVQFEQVLRLKDIVFNRLHINKA